MALVNRNKNLVQVSGGGSVSGRNNVKPAIQSPPKNTSIEDYQKAEQIVNNPAMSGMSGVKGGGTGNGPAITQDVKPTTTPSIVQVDSSVKNGTPTGNNPFAGGNINKTNDKSFVNEADKANPTINITGMENKPTIEEKVETEPTPATPKEEVEAPKEEVIDEKAQAREEAYQAKKDSIMQHYQDQVDKLNKNTLNAKNEAHQAQQLASKYAENGLKQMGLNNTGLTESSNQANINNYMNAISGINASKAETEASINQNYKDQLANLEDEEAQRLEQEEAELEAENDAYNNRVMNEATSLIENLSDEDLESYLAEIEADTNLSQSTKDFLKRYASAVNNKQTKADYDTTQSKAISDFEKYYEYLSDEEREKELATLLDRDDLSDETKAEIQKYANAVDNQETLINGTDDQQINDKIDDVDSIINNGEFNGMALTEVQKQEMSNFRDKLANATTADEANKIYNEMENYLRGRGTNGEPAPSKTFEGPIDTNKGKVNNNGDTFENNYGDRKQGNNFSLNIGGEIKRVQTGQAVLYGSELDKKLEGYSQECGALAVVNGVLYARDKECWYVVEPRNDSHWKDIKDNYGLKDYGKGYDLGKNGFDNSTSRKNQPSRQNGNNTTNNTTSSSSGNGSKASPITMDVPFSTDKDVSAQIKSGQLKEGDYVVTGDGMFDDAYIVKNGKLEFVCKARNLNK